VKIGNNNCGDGKPSPLLCVIYGLSTIYSPCLSAKTQAEKIFKKSLKKVKKSVDKRPWL
jgi:hypothetical protein